MKYKIHYAKIDIQGDIPCLEFNSIDEVRNFVSSIIYPLKTENDKVYIIGIDDEVFVTENPLFVEELFESNLNSVYPYYEGEDIVIQEVGSYKDAYDTALALKEISPLCYNKND